MYYRRIGPHLEGRGRYPSPYHNTSTVISPRSLPRWTGDGGGGGYPTQAGEYQSQVGGTPVPGVPLSQKGSYLSPREGYPSPRWRVFSSRRGVPQSQAGAEVPNPRQGAPQSQAWSTPVPGGGTPQDMGTARTGQSCDCLVFYPFLPKTT